MIFRVLVLSLSDYREMFEAGDRTHRITLLFSAIEPLPAVVPHCLKSFFPGESAVLSWDQLSQ